VLSGCCVRACSACLIRQAHELCACCCLLSVLLPLLMQAPDLYLGYGAARDSPAQYSFEYPADWEEAVVTKTDKSTMVSHRPGAQRKCCCCAAPHSACCCGGFTLACQPNAHLHPHMLRQPVNAAAHSVMHRLVPIGVVCGGCAERSSASTRLNRLSMTRQYHLWKCCGQRTVMCVVCRAWTAW
jgi:hypothetical protein